MGLINRLAAAPKQDAAWKCGEEGEGRLRSTQRHPRDGHWMPKAGSILSKEPYQKSEVRELQSSSETYSESSLYVTDFFFIQSNDF